MIEKKQTPTQSTRTKKTGSANSHNPSQTGVRINIFLSRAGLASRRQADEMVTRGKVKVNKNILASPGAKIDPKTDVVEYQGPGGVWTIIEQSPEAATIYALYKPKGYITSTKRIGDDPIVMSLFPKAPRVFPVGRLDKDSEGLIICTNDGDLAATLTHPRTHIEKEYTVHCIIPRDYTENILKSKLGRIAKGVSIQGRRTLPAKITFKRYLRPNMVEIDILIKEGRNRQIRRMLGAIDLEVYRLIRTRIGKLSLEKLELKHGSYTRVTSGDIL